MRIEDGDRKTYEPAHRPGSLETAASIGCLGGCLATILGVRLMVLPITYSWRLVRQTADWYYQISHRKEIAWEGNVDTLEQEIQSYLRRLTERAERAGSVVKNTRDITGWEPKMWGRILEIDLPAVGPKESSTTETYFVSQLSKDSPIDDYTVQTTNLKREDGSSYALKYHELHLNDGTTYRNIWSVRDCSVSRGDDEKPLLLKNGPLGEIIKVRDLLHKSVTGPIVIPAHYHKPA